MSAPGQSVPPPEAKGEVDTEGIAEKVSYPVQTTRRALEDLNAHHVLERPVVGTGKSHYWRLSKWARSQCAKIFPTVPENAGGEYRAGVPEKTGN
jgi:hypothetical protein